MPASNVGHSEHEHVGEDDVHSLGASLGLMAPAVKPFLRGVAHQHAFVVSVCAGILVCCLADGRRALLAAALHAICVSAILGVSAAYHRINWRGDWVRHARRADHATIYVAMGGIYTAFWLVALSGPVADFLLAVLWIGAAGGIALKLLWLDAPRWLATTLYMLLGLTLLLIVPELASSIGSYPTTLLLLGGMFHLIGATVFAIGRPDPVPHILGFHEIFHGFVTAGITVQYIVFALYVLPLK